jgi:hypothetical protein
LADEIEEGYIFLGQNHIFPCLRLPKTQHITERRRFAETFSISKPFAIKENPGPGRFWVFTGIRAHQDFFILNHYALKYQLEFTKLFRIFAGCVGQHIPLEKTNGVP